MYEEKGPGQALIAQEAAVVTVAVRLIVAVVNWVLGHRNPPTVMGPAGKSHDTLVDR